MIIFQSTFFIDIPCVSPHKRYSLEFRNLKYENGLKFNIVA